MLAREVVLIDQRFDRLVSVLSDGIFKFKAANKLGVGYNTAELCKSADQ